MTDTTEPRIAIREVKEWCEGRRTQVRRAISQARWSWWSLGHKRAVIGRWRAAADELEGLLAFLDQREKEGDAPSK